MSVPPGRRDGRRIIVTDDDPTKLYMLTQTLRDAGHCVFAAYDGLSALELVFQLPNVDLLITNTRLGLIDGPELMRRTHALRPDLPILHVSHDGTTVPVDTPGGVPTLTEPFSPNELLHAVRHLLG
jgi:CheY-like chemotaxis protein